MFYMLCYESYPNHGTISSLTVTTATGWCDGDDGDPSTLLEFSTTQPPILVGDAGKSVLPAARVMTSPSVSSTSTRQYSDETLKEHSGAF